MPTRFSSGDAANQTSSSRGDVSQAWHDARDDAVDEGYLARGGGNERSLSEPSHSPNGPATGSGDYPSSFGGWLDWVSGRR